MKNLNKISFFILLIISFSTLTSCDFGPDFDIPDQPPLDIHINTIDEANYELRSRVWKMTNVNVSTVNPNIMDYKLIFNPDNTLITTYGEIKHTGTWSVTDDNLNQDIVSDLKLNLVFSSPTIFDPMSKNWTFNLITLSYSTGDEMEFVYINNGVSAGSFTLKEIK